MVEVRWFQLRNKTALQRHRMVVIALSFYVIIPVFCLAWCPAQAQATGLYSKQQVEAAYLYKFLLFVRSPQQVSSPHKTICILGDKQLGKYLQPMAGKNIKGSGKKLFVKVVSGDLLPQNISDCSLLFIGQKYRKNLTDLLKRLQNRPILTISDMANFVQDGGMLGLVEYNGRLRWQINQDAVEKSGLALSSQLLRSALVVLNKKTAAGDAL